MSEYNINQLKKSIKTKALTLFRRCVVRDGRAEAPERPDGLLPEAGAARGQRVGGRAAEVRAHAAADHGRGECCLLTRAGNEPSRSSQRRPPTMAFSWLQPALN